MRKFRDRTLQILVATDVAARGLDVDDITHVINYNLPDEPDRYTHRSGRTARAGKSGTSIMLVNTREARRLTELERRAGVKFENGQVPQGRDICEKQLFAMVNRMVQVEVNQEEIERYLPPVYKTLGSLSKEELIQRFVSAEFNRFLDYYREAGDLNARPAAGTPRETAPTKKNIGDTQSFFIGVGRLDKINEGAIVRLICDKAGIRSHSIGQIAIKREFSFFDVERKVAQKVFNALKGAKLDTRTIDIRFADTLPVTAKKKKRREPVRPWSAAQKRKKDRK
jgi:ATP-dependent RNA helicase DeaD